MSKSAEAFREALRSIVRRFEQEDKGGLATRPGLAWAMYSDAKKALEKRKANDPAPER